MRTPPIMFPARVPKRRKRHSVASSPTPPPAGVTVLNVQAHIGLARFFFSDDVLTQPDDTLGYVVVIDGEPRSDGEIVNVDGIIVDFSFPDATVLAGSAWSVSGGGGIVFESGDPLSVPQSGTVVPE